MSNGKVSEDNLFKFLKHLGVYEEDRSKKGRAAAVDTSNDVDTEVNEMFDGDVKKFVNDILVTRQHYLKKDRVDTGIS